MDIRFLTFLVADQLFEDSLLDLLEGSDLVPADRNGTKNRNGAQQQNTFLVGKAEPNNDFKDGCDDESFFPAEVVDDGVEDDGDHDVAEDDGALDHAD